MIKKIIIVCALLIMLFTIYFYVLKENNTSQPKKYEYMGNKTFGKEVNEWLDEKAELRKNITPEQKEYSRKFWERMAAISEASIDDIEFYGKVIDQYGNPVANADIYYYTGNAYLASGTGRGTTKTNDNGIFTTREVRGTSYNITAIQKEGYEFKTDIPPRFDGYKRFPDSILWTDYNNENSPYIFTMDKVDRYANVVKFSGGYNFLADGREYTLDLRKHRTKAKKQGVHRGDLRVSFTRNDVNKQWSAVISVIDGGLQETTDLYMNKAPEAGYQESYTYSGIKDRVNRLEKKYYFISRNGKNYGRMEISISPYMAGKKIKSGMSVKAVINLEGGRDLGVRPKHPYQ